MKDVGLGTSWGYLYSWERLVDCYMGKWIATSNGSFFAPTNVTVAGFVVCVCVLSLFFLRSKKELYYIKAEYIIKIHTTLSKYSHTKQLQISIPNLCKKSNRMPHRYTLSKQAENKRPKNDDQHPVGWNEHNLLLHSCVFLLPLSATDEEERQTLIYPIQDWLKSTLG